MKKRLLVIAVVVCLMVSLVACSGADSKDGDTSDAVKKGEYKLRLSHSFMSSSMIQESCLLFKEEVEKNSDGRIKVEVYSDMSLLPTAEEIPAILDGRIEATSTYAWNCVNVSPNYRIFDLAMLFGDPNVSIDNLMDFTNSDFFKENIGKNFEDKGIKYYLTVQDTDRAIWTTQRKVTTADGYKGLKVRSVGGKAAEILADAWGFSAITVSSTELPTALMQGTVDGAILGPVYGYDTNPPNLKYCTIPSADYTGTMGFLISKKWFDSLPADLQKVVDDAGYKQFEYTRDETVKRAQLNLAEDGRIKNDMGVEVIFLSEDERQKLWDMYAPVVKKYAEEQGFSHVLSYVNEKYNVYSDEYKAAH